VQNFLRLILVGLLTALALRGASSLDDARRAQAMLGAETWSRIIRIENATPNERYPAVVDALVFEEGGLLWFYTAPEGTQSLSLHWNRLAEEKSDLAPLLREISAGFTRFTVLPDAPSAVWVNADDPLPNGCFIECLAALRMRVMRGDRIERPRLLSCYVNTAAGRFGHTVLTYETSRGFFLLDPTRSARPRLVPRVWKDEPMALATLALDGAKVVRARWVPVENRATSVVASYGHNRKWTEAAATRLMQ